MLIMLICIGIDMDTTVKTIVCEYDSSKVYFQVDPVLLSPLSSEEMTEATSSAQYRRRRRHKFYDDDELLDSGETPY